MKTNKFYDYDPMGLDRPPERRRRTVTCKRCDFQWKVRGKNPVRCSNPACRSPYWNRPHQNGISTARALRLQRLERQRAAGMGSGRTLPSSVLSTTCEHSEVQTKGTDS